jgi:hypothetical protein
MVTGTRARTYEEMVDALAEEDLPALQAKLSDLTSEDGQRPTLLQPPEADKPPWTVLDEFVATRLVETRVHGLDLTDALGAPPAAHAADDCHGGRGAGRGPGAAGRPGASGGSGGR